MSSNPNSQIQQLAAKMQQNQHYNHQHSAHIYENIPDYLLHHLLQWVEKSSLISPDKIQCSKHAIAWRNVFARCANDMEENKKNLILTEGERTSKIGILESIAKAYAAKSLNLQKEKAWCDNDDHAEHDLYVCANLKKKNKKLSTNNL